MACWKVVGSLWEECWAFCHKPRLAALRALGESCPRCVESRGPGKLDSHCILNTPCFSQARITIWVFPRGSLWWGPSHLGWQLMVPRLPVFLCRLGWGESSCPLDCEEKVKQIVTCLMIPFPWRTELWVGRWILASQGRLGVWGRF